MGTCTVGSTRQDAPKKKKIKIKGNDEALFSRGSGSDSQLPKARQAMTTRVETCKILIARAAAEVLAASSAAGRSQDLWTRVRWPEEKGNEL